MAAIRTGGVVRPWPQTGCVHTWKTTSRARWRAAACFASKGASFPSWAPPEQTGDPGGTKTDKRFWERAIRLSQGPAAHCWLRPCSGLAGSPANEMRGLLTDHYQLPVSPYSSQIHPQQRSAMRDSHGLRSHSLHQSFFKTPSSNIGGSHSFQHHTMYRGGTDE